MLRFLFQRPIAVLLTFVVLLIFGVVSFWQLPISLLPALDVPKIVIQVQYPNTVATALEQNVMKPIRENLTSLANLKNIESKCTNHSGLLYLTFEYGTRMDLAYIEVNEKLDRLINFLPHDLPRPQVTRLNTSDIPIIRLQIVPKKEEDFTKISELTEKVLRKRLEQLDGVSVVDINGAQHSLVCVSPQREALQALGLDELTLAQAIQMANQNLGGLSLKDGQYRYFVRVNNALESSQQIANLPIRTPSGVVVPLSRLARVTEENEIPTGYHWFNGQKGLVATIQKQASSKMNELVPHVREAVFFLAKDYPQIQFSFTQDQTFLLDAGIQNLYQDLIYGGILAVAVLFLFLGNYASPVLMSLNIPISLVLTCIFFYLFDISLNIISLSGLALGIGMLIDNSIVVLDNITRKRREGLDMLESCVQGTSEVITPVLSQVLPTIAVYAPLVALSGMAGALVFDQALALTISLGVSLLVAFVLSPVLYRLFLRRSPDELKEDTRFYGWILRAYHRFIQAVFRRKKLFLSISALATLSVFWLVAHIPITALPKLEKTETLLKIDWNEPIDVRENEHRIRLLDDFIVSSNHPILQREAEIGIKQFLLQQEDNALTRADFYFACQNEAIRDEMNVKISRWLHQHYPTAIFQILDAPNAFTQLFSDNSPYFEARFKPINAETANYAALETVFQQRFKENLWAKGEGLAQDPAIAFQLDYNKLADYDINPNQLTDKLTQLFGTYLISEIKRFGYIKPVQLSDNRKTMQDKLKETIPNRNNNTNYPLSFFVEMALIQQYKFVTADKTGDYKSMIFSDKNIDYAALEEKIKEIALQQGFSAYFVGQYFEQKILFRQLFFIFMVSILLLYFILAVQFEHLIQPFFVLLTMPLGVAGALFMLYINGSALDVMAAIGFIVVLGIVVDDPILKVDTINRLVKKYEKEGKNRREALTKAIYDAGDICLKPLLMTSLTTSLALVPVLFTGGIGSDLQKTFVYVIIGGLTIGTFLATWFVPLVYWVFSRK